MAAPLQIAIIGCGSFAAEHAAALRALPDARLRACCDTDAERAQAFQRDQGAAYATTDAARVFGDPSIDAVLICTRHDSHAALAVAAAGAGKHALVEKPLAMHARECLAIGAAADGAGIVLMPAFKFRFEPLVTELRERVPHPYLLIGQLTDERWPDDFWANDAACGGGHVFSQGGHLLDLVCAAAGGDVARVHAEGGNFRHPDLPYADTVAVTLTFAHGACASVVLADGGAAPLLSKFSLQVFDGGTAAHLHARCTRLTLRTGGVTAERARDGEEGVLREDAAFIDAIRRGAPSPISWRDGHRAVALLEAIAQSLQRRAPVDLPAPPAP
jgi:predicted dehydrogenase